MNAREKARKRSRDWYYANPERVRAHNRGRKQAGDGHSQRWRKNNPEKNRQYYLKSVYGITAEFYDAALAEQGGVCAICGGPPAGKGVKNGLYQVDHDHATGHVRGLLCGHCNTVLGHAKDSTTTLEKAIAYLKK